MTIFGLTGGIAVGKTTISNKLKNDGYLVIDADEVTHVLYQSDKNVINTMSQNFPEAFQDNKINRKVLSKIVMENKNALSQIEQIMHQAVFQHINHIISQLPNTKPVILSAPLLFETGLNKLCNKIICLYANKKTQKNRALTRPGMSSEKFELLYNNQWTNNQRKSMSDLWVSTEISEHETYRAIIQFLKKYT